MYARRARFGHAARTTGNNDAADTGQLVGRGVDRQHMALHTDFAHAPREKMTVLAARVEDCDSVHGESIADVVVVGSRRSTVGSPSRQSKPDSSHGILGMRCACRGGMVAKSVEELLVYQKALAACDDISALVERLNLGKDFELRQQLNSAAGSIPANIAEGFGQQTDRQFARYLYFARGSSKEICAHLAVARGRRYLADSEVKDLSGKYEEIARMLTGLIKYLRTSDRKDRG